MITFRETIDGLERLTELLRTVPDAEEAVNRALSGLADLRSMLDSPRVRQAAGTKEVREYIDRVVIPQLTGVRDALEVGTKDSFRRLRTAQEQADRMMVRLQMLSDGSVDSLLG
ncbi:MAG: hypothetical protein A2Z17_05970 [Gammaproteobacteria bacterium RBG_16_66_13]|jgi:hypothetical protein|nr:MAG: hypothetical protein A2Z17_05970 [Gammaproteobacteria bacterium RBG_16_66_13]